jgi:hypothetical protein
VHHSISQYILLFLTIAESKWTFPCLNGYWIDCWYCYSWILQLVSESIRILISTRFDSWYFYFWLSQPVSEPINISMGLYWILWLILLFLTITACKWTLPYINGSLLLILLFLTIAGCNFVSEPINILMGLCQILWLILLFLIIEERKWTHPYLNRSLLDLMTDTVNLDYCRE